MPISHSFYNRLSRSLPRIVEHYGSPFHIYDEIGIRETGQLLIKQFSAIPGFQEYFAVKALPNPEILRIMKSMGFGFDCSSIAELILSRNTGAIGEELMFTSNNTSQQEFLFACKDGGSILNLDDITLISKLTEIPERISFPASIIIRSWKRIKP